ncbi:MAG TPA: extracellular solute-binding protein [Burkholderiaceae bacterium]
MDRGCALLLSALLLASPGLAATPPAAPASAPLDAPAEARWVHAYAAFGAPARPRGFDHFPYANPDAPKGGTLYLHNPDRRTSFDKFNPFTVRGNAPAGVSIFMFEPLALRAADELQTMYGLLAESMQIAPDKSSISFRLDPRARFSNGDPVTAEDVRLSFELQAGPQASPISQTAFAGVEKATVLDERTIRFDLKDRSTDMLFTVGGLAVFSHKWGLQPDGKRKRFDDIVSEYPITTGPYTIALAESGRRIEFRRDANYWARDLNLRKGFFNFDRIVYRYYKDAAVSTEAFKAGEYDLVKVYGSRTWARQMKGARWDDGRIVKQLFPVATGQGLQASDFNLRRKKFQDIRVREAIALTWDFDTINKYKLFKRAYSLFNNSEFAAEGLPSAAELALLEPYRAELPKEVFGPAYRPPETHAEPARLRAQLLHARDLLAQAGWKIAPDGKLRNAQGEAFVIEYLTPNEGARDPAWEHNLAKLGIELDIRQVDFALYRRRLEQYDFDVITIVEGTFTIPSPTDYATLYGSKSADEPGNNNFRGVKSKAVDHILEAMQKATTLEDLRSACRALDRVVMWSHWQIPELYSPFEPASYWNRFGMPKTLPKYYDIDTPTDLPWPLFTWWVDPSKHPKQR